MPLRQCLSDTYDAPSQPDQYLALLVIAQSLEDAAGTGPKPTISERVDAIEFVRGDWRLALWCDAARIMPELVQQAAVIVEPPVAQQVHARRLGIERAREIRAQWASGVQQVVLAKRYGVRPEAIRRIVSGKAWREVVTG
jgi:hypothetical protein